MAHQTQERYIVRFPDGMRDFIKVMAEESGRSMNSEIIYRLKVAYAAIENKKADATAS